MPSRQAGVSIIANCLFFKRFLLVSPKKRSTAKPARMDGSRTELVAPFAFRSARFMPKAKVRPSHLVVNSPPLANARDSCSLPES